MTLNRRGLPAAFVLLLAILASALPASSSAAAVTLRPATAPEPSPTSSASTQPTLSPSPTPAGTIQSETQGPHVPPTPFVWPKAGIHRAGAAAAIGTNAAASQGTGSGSGEILTVPFARGTSGRANRLFLQRTHCCDDLRCGPGRWPRDVRCLLPIYEFFWSTHHPHPLSAIHLRLDAVDQRRSR